MNVLHVALFTLISAAPIMAAVKTQPIEYKVGETTCIGYLAYDDTMPAANEKRPGVIVVHEWWGLSEYPKSRAEQLAKLGYVAFVADMYGEGKTTRDPKQAEAWMLETVKNPQLIADRFNAALAQLRKQEPVDPQRIAAIGYCFGGGVVMNMARAGADLKGVVSFHGMLITEKPAAKGAVKAKLLACHAADDTFEPADSVARFQKEMTDAGVDWQVNIYSRAMHAFTNPDADKFNIPGIAYSAEADRRSWSAMTAFCDEIFSKQ